jgi:hypothetical protein
MRGVGFGAIQGKATTGQYLRHQTRIKITIFYNGGMIREYFKNRTVPLLFFLTTIIAYGLLLPQTGFYWDDWPFVWIAKFLGPKEFLPAFANVRPFLGPIFFVTTSLIPPVPIYWQIFALIIRFLSGLFAWYAFDQIWPQHKRQTLIAALLFLVFPGYSQHWVAFTHINQEWIPFLFYLLSFGFTARAFRNPQKYIFNTLFALLFLIAGVFPTEYFIGLEPLRYLFIWVIVAEQTHEFRERILQTLKRWTPYLLIWLANIAWLTYYYTLGSYDSYDIEVTSQPHSVAQIITGVVDAIWKAGIYLWVQGVLLIANSVLAPTSLLALLLIIVAFVFFVFYLRNFDSSKPKNNFAVSALIIGVIGILLGRLPSFAAGLPLTLQSSNDRFMISMMIGGSLFIVGLVELILRDLHVKTFIFALMIALGIGQQLYNANLFRRDWLKQQDFLWQLSWRIPALKQNTLLMTDQLPVDYETDLSFTAPIIWMYDPDYQRASLPYGLVYTEKRLGGSLPSLQPGEPVKIYLRTVNFAGSTSQAVVFFMPRNGCLRVLSPDWGDEITYGRQSGYLLKAIPLSNPDLIIANTNAPAKISFLSEPEHTWCYYYAKAELARQQKNWKQVIQLFEQASSHGYQPSDPFEMLVFIEARAMTGDIAAAENLSKQAMETDKGIRKGLCQVWKRVQENDPARDEDHLQVDKILINFQCVR